MAMQRLLLLAAFGVLGTYQQTTCTTPTVVPSNPTPGATPASLTMCFPITVAAPGLAATNIILLTPQPAPGVFNAATTAVGTFPAAAGTCTTGTPFACAATGVCTYTLPAGCTLTLGQSVNVVFSNLGANPIQGLQYFTITQVPAAAGVAFPAGTTVQATSYAVGAPSPSPIQDSTATICGAVASTFPTPQAACSITQPQLSTLATQILGVSPGGQGAFTCPSTTYGNAFVFEYTNPIWQQTISSTGARSFTIYSWGNMVAPQMVALAITYPVTATNLQALNLNEWGVPNGASSLVPSRSTPEFLVRIVRWTPAGVLANDANPLSFIVAAGNGWQPIISRPITTVLLVDPCTGAAVAVTGAVGSWAMSALTGEVLVIAQRGGLFVGYSTPALELAPSSDEALLGLLALVALPFLCCCCLALWLWRRAKNAPFPCCSRQNSCPCPCPMQELAVQQCMPVQNMAVAATVPPCTPVFPMPYY